MNCETTRKQLPLYLYSELSFDEEETVAQHLDGCEACRKELQREKRIHCAADMAEVRPTAELLERCRLDLARAVRLAGPPRRRISWSERLRWLFGGPSGLPMAWLRPAGVVALVAIGFFTARITTVTPAGSGLGSPSDEPVATTVRYVEPSEAGKVRIVVDETRQKVFSGSLDDEMIQQMLLTAVRNPSAPGVRAESLDLLQSSSGSEEVLGALLYALEHDPNDGVRLKAIEKLRPYATAPRSRAVLSRVLLNDDNPGIRSMAIDLLVETDGRDVVETLQEVMRREDNNYVRLRSQQALEDMNASVETF